MAKEEYLTNFATNVFTHAEEEYQSGNATKNTAKSFLHASVFFESLKHFAPLSEEVNGKIRYSKWKATEIMTAIQEGRRPGPAGVSEMQLDEEMNGAGAGGGNGMPVDVPDVPSFGNMSYAASPMSQFQQSPLQQPQRPASTPAAKPNLKDSGDLDLPDVPVFSHSQLSTQQARPSAPPSQPQYNSAPNNFSSGAPQQSPFGAHPSSQPSSFTQPHQQQHMQEPQQQHGPRPPHESSAPVPKPTSSGFNQFIQSRVVYQPKSAPANIDVILEATKFSKNAISALQFDDPETAVKNLRAALRVLTGSDQ